jgi:hypothetical protein
MRNAIIGMLALALAGIAGGASAQTFVNADVVVNTTWGGAANPSPIILGKPIFVKSGATLTILPGTIVRGQPRLGPAAGGAPNAPGALVITQDGRGVIRGNPQNPIIFTTAAIDNNNDNIPDIDGGTGFPARYQAGDTFFDADPRNLPLAPIDGAGAANVSLWGGLVVLGNAPTNLGSQCVGGGGVPGYGQCTVEGLAIPGFDVNDATYGGVEPHDSSGIYQYLSVRHAGDEIANGNELNGITMAAVGDGTLFDHIEVYMNFDDGIEWFGGTVDGSFLHVAFVGDDAFDVDQGYTGVNQFMLGIMAFFQGSGGSFNTNGDEGGEWDGDDFNEAPDGDLRVNVRVTESLAATDPTPWPLQATDMYNLTILGGQSGAPGNDTGRVLMRNGFAGSLHNSIVVNTGAQQPIDVNGGGGSPGFSAANNANAGYLNVLCSSFDDGAAIDATTLVALTNGNALTPHCGGSAALGANVEGGLFPGLVNETTTFTPTGNGNGVLVPGIKVGGAINPRVAFGLQGTGGCCPPQGKCLDRSATYRGAFDPAAATIWTTPWTVLNIAGLMVD